MAGGAAAGAAYASLAAAGTAAAASRWWEADGILQSGERGDVVAGADAR